MTYQNIMIDRIKEIIISCDCTECTLTDQCTVKDNYCIEILKWLNEQYI